eukprot:Phypoly_transcript_10495.p1 GENE.Phypoly_transcript_10495~~Phypoly_transcript_10495.p1  ORF type:complete len:238 (-),score=45.46 Phypoly_transcript_10495:26-739(-)
MQETYIGVGLLIVYSIISQIMLVNLLIAMMGDTYSSVKANADKEWKFYRYGLISEFSSNSSYPPPFNLIFGPINYLKKKIFPKKEFTEDQSPITAVHMKIARDKIIEMEKENEKNSLEALSDFIRESWRLNTNHVNGDRVYLESNMKSLHKSIEDTTKVQSEMLTSIQALNYAFLGQERSIFALSAKLDSFTQQPSQDQFRAMQNTINTQQEMIETLQKSLDRLNSQLSNLQKDKNK